MDEYLRDRKEALDRFNLPDTPFVIFCGPNLNEIKCYLQIENYRYEKFEDEDFTPIQAVDFCFRSYIALRKGYALACKASLTFLEGFVFEIPNDKREVSKDLSVLLKDLNIKE